MREVLLLPDGTLHIHMLDVGQGDAIFAVTPAGKRVLIDGGPNLATLTHLGTLLPFFTRNIDLLVLTHPDADHVTALPDVIRRYDVGTVLMTGAEHSSGRYDALRSAIAETDTAVLFPDPHTDIDMGDGVVLDVIWPTAEYVGASNDRSIVLRLLYDETAVLFAGDIEEEAEAAILAAGFPVASNVLKVAHHGSRTSSSTGFLLAVNPELALVSAGRENRFGHPHADVMARYDALGIIKKITAELGMISLEY